MRILQEQKGVIIIIVSLALAILLLMGSYLLSFTIAESKISKSQTISIKTYYLAEAGVHEAIWKLKNDPVWQENFENEPDCHNWQSSFVRNYLPNTTTTITIQNVQCAKGEIIATSTVSLAAGKIAQRVVKVKVLKALGSLTEDSPIISGSPSGETTIQASIMNVYDGNIFINNNFNIKLWSEVSVYDNAGTPDTLEGKVLVVNNNNLSWNSTLNADSICAKNICHTTSTCECQDFEKFEQCTIESCPPQALATPTIDFDSDNPSSYKNKANQAQQQGQCSIVGKNSGETVVVTSHNCLFSEDEFADLLWQVGEGGKLVLEHQTNGLAVSTYYVEGGINLKGGRHLEIDGVLVADKTINIGEKYKWGGDHGFNQITISDPGYGFPSGLLTKGKMNFGMHSSFGDTNITGLIYSQDEMRLTSLPHTFNVVGGIVARKFSLVSAWNSLNIYLDNDIIIEGVWGGLKPPAGEKPPYAPVVTVEHWEESY